MRSSRPLFFALPFVCLAAACGSNGMATDDGGSGASTGAAGGSSSQGGGGGGGGAGSSAVVINEIMANPEAASDSAGEWIELYNPGSTAVSLEGWTLSDHGGDSHVIASALTIAPGGYVVLARSADAGSNGGLPADYAYGDDFNLANAGDAVVLSNAEGELVDSVEYGSGAAWPAISAGVSLELSAPSLDNADGASWQLAVLPYGDGDRGTPGGPNGGTVGEGYTINDTVGDWHDQALKTKLLFAPQDDLEAHVLAVLGTAQSSIELAFFNIRHDDVRDLLIQKKNMGVDVEVLLDKKQQDLPYNTMAAELTQAGVSVTLIENTSAAQATMHNKFAVVDGKLVMTGSANYSFTALNISDEDLITIESASLAQRYQTELDELIAQGDAVSPSYPPSTPIQAWMGPEDNLWGKAKDLLDGAQQTALVAMFALNSSTLIDALIAAKGRGVNVVVVLDEVQANDPAATADETLESAGVKVVLAHNTGNMVAEMHSKFLVVDHSTVLMGSYNWTNLASYYNDENVVVLDDAGLAARVEGKLAQLINDYASVSPGSLGLTTGSQQVSFKVSNVILEPGVDLMIESVGGGPFQQPVALSDSTLTASIAAGTRVIYRYLISKQGTPLLKEAVTHSFTVPYASGPFSVTDAFQVP